MTPDFKYIYIYIIARLCWGVDRVTSKKNSSISKIDKYPVKVFLFLNRKCKEELIELLQHAQGA